MADVLLASVEQHLQPRLEKEGFILATQDYRPELFGNSILTFMSSQYWLRLESERGQVFASVGAVAGLPPNDMYFDLWYIAEFLNHADFPRNYVGTTERQVQRIARFLLAHWEQIFTLEILQKRADELRAFIQERQRVRVEQMQAEARTHYEKTQAKVPAKAKSKRRRDAIILLALAIFNPFTLFVFYVIVEQTKLKGNNSNPIGWLGQLISSQSSATIALYGLVVVGLVTIYLRSRPELMQRIAGKKAVPAASPIGVYMGLREQALKGFSVQFPDDSQIWGALLELGLGNGTATVTSFANGDASMYTSSGGGVLGGGMHDTVRKAAQEFVSAAQKSVDKMQPTGTYPLPGTGKVRFYAMSTKTIYTAEVDRQTVESGQSDLLPLYAAGQNVITQLRLAQQSRT